MAHTERIRNYAFVYNLVVNQFFPVARLWVTSYCQLTKVCSGPKRSAGGARLVEVGNLRPLPLPSFGHDLVRDS